MILSELNCKDISNEADKSSDCNVTVSTDSCSSNRSVWLHCTNKTGDILISYHVTITIMIELIIIINP